MMSKLTRPLFDMNNIQPGFHLVLSKDPNEATYWMNIVYGKLDGESYSSEVSCLYNYGNTSHRSIFEKEVRDLQKTNRKLFLSTMNPDVVNRFYWSNINDLQRRIIIVEDGGDGLFVGVNMTDDEAYDLNLAHDVGIQPVRELLWQKGIW